MGSFRDVFWGSGVAIARNVTLTRWPDCISSCRWVVCVSPPMITTVQWHCTSITPVTPLRIDPVRKP
jgi:hypothetical protein